MDPLTHTLSGAVWAKVGAGRRYGRAAALALIGGAILPDADIILRLWGTTTYFRYHRGITHSLFGAALFAAILAYPIYRLGPRRGYGALFGLCLLGIYTHIFLDLITSYGTHLLAPFDATKYSLDLVFILDLPLTATFVVPLLIAWRRPNRARIAAGWGLLAAALYLLFCSVNHRIALSKVRDAVKAQNLPAMSLSAFPMPLSPFRWMSVVPTPGGFYQTWVNTLRSDPLEFQYTPSNMSDGYVQQTKDLDIVRFFHDFAKFPVARYWKDGSRYIVEYSDLRFALFPDADPFVLQITMDETGAVRSVVFPLRREGVLRWIWRKWVE